MTKTMTLSVQGNIKNILLFTNSLFTYIELHNTFYF